MHEAMRQPDASEWRRRSLEKYEAQFVLFCFVFEGTKRNLVAGL